MSHELERADLHRPRPPRTLKEAQQMKKAWEAGMPCCVCGERATVRRSDGHYFCQMDARIAAQRERREAMRNPEIARYDFRFVGQ